MVVVRGVLHAVQSGTDVELREGTEISAQYRRHISQNHASKHSLRTLLEVYCTFMPLNVTGRVEHCLVHKMLSQVQFLSCELEFREQQCIARNRQGARDDRTVSGYRLEGRRREKK